MALSEFEIKKCEKELEAFMAVRRPPMHIRPELDLGYRIENQSIEIFEIVLLCFGNSTDHLTQHTK